MDAAALDSANVATILLDPTIPDGTLRTSVDFAPSRATLEQAIAQVRTLARPPADMTYDELVARYRRISRFRPRFLATMTLDAVPGWEACAARLPVSSAGRGSPQHHADRCTAPDRHHRVAIQPTTAEQRVDRIGYTYCVLDRLVNALRRREVFVQPSLRYADPRIGLLHGAAWEAARLQVCRALVKPADGATALSQLSAN